MPLQQLPRKKKLRHMLQRERKTKKQRSMNLDDEEAAAATSLFEQGCSAQDRQEQPTSTTSKKKFICGGKSVMPCLAAGNLFVADRQPRAGSNKVTDDSTPKAAVNNNKDADDARLEITTTLEGDPLCLTADSSDCRGRGGVLALYNHQMAVMVPPGAVVVQAPRQTQLQLQQRCLVLQDEDNDNPIVLCVQDRRILSHRAFDIYGRYPLHELQDRAKFKVGNRAFYPWYRFVSYRVVGGKNTSINNTDNKATTIGSICKWDGQRAYKAFLNIQKLSSFGSGGSTKVVISRAETEESREDGDGNAAGCYAVLQHHGSEDAKGLVGEERGPGWHISNMNVADPCLVLCIAAILEDAKLCH